MDFEEKLEQMAKQLWSLMKKSKDIIVDQNQDIVFTDNYNQFRDCYCEMYKEIQSGYMQNAEELDRHKVAAIMMVSIIEARPLSVKQTEKKFLANYVLAADAGFNYMLDDLNRILKNNKMNSITRYAFPDALSCDTYYYRIFYRNLYYTDSNPDWTYNPLEMADKLFLIEYITLKENNIRLADLKNKH